MGNFYSYIETYATTRQIFLPTEIDAQAKNINANVKRKIIFAYKL